MAFQGDVFVYGFLRHAAKSFDIGLRAPAENFLLEERLAPQREQQFVSARMPPSVSAWDEAVWQVSWRNHYESRIKLGVARATRVATFTDANRENWLETIESHQDVVRLESATSLFDLSPRVFDSPTELIEFLRLHVERKLSPDQTARLQEWLKNLNEKRDARPPFVAPFGEVQDIIDEPDWASRLRDMLGLASFSGTPIKPMIAILCRYSLKRAETAARLSHRMASAALAVPSTLVPSPAGKATWAAVPTVLEAGGERGPHPAFFPLPRSAGSLASPFGITLSLASDQEFSVTSELLHFRINYQLEDFVKVGEIRDEIPEPPC